MRISIKYNNKEEWFIMDVIYKIPTYKIEEDERTKTISQDDDINLIVSVSDEKRDYLKLTVSDDKHYIILSEVYVTRKELERMLNSSVF
jgi:hypothetical protein